MDDITISGSLEGIQHDLQVIEEESQDLGLPLNHQKSEIVCSGPTTCASLTSAMPDAKVVAVTTAVLLRSSVRDIYSIFKTISEKTQLLKTMGSCLQYLSAHDAILLPSHSFAILKMRHILRTSPCFGSFVLQSYDLQADSLAWTQASVPVTFGGLGVRSAVQLSSLAFLASTISSEELISQILPPHLQATSPSHLGEAKAESL